VKGAFAPQRGLFFQLSPREVLMTLTGPNDGKRPEDGLPFPVLLRLHRGSTFDDVVYLAQQLYVFANLSWRSFFPSSMPVTILYSQLIAGLRGELHRLRGGTPTPCSARSGERGGSYERHLRDPAGRRRSQPPPGRAPLTGR
jgi:hypothetical protein